VVTSDPAFSLVILKLSSELEYFDAVPEVG
jgi:hypothetical protein